MDLTFQSQLSMDLTLRTVLESQAAHAEHSRTGGQEGEQEWGEENFPFSSWIQCPSFQSYSPIAG